MHILAVCDNSSMLNTILFIKNMISIIFIVVPIVLVLLFSIDLFKNVFSQDSKDNQKNFKLGIKRIVYSIILMFVPLLIKTFMGMIDNYSKVANCYTIATEEKVQELHAQEETEYQTKRDEVKQQQAENAKKIEEEKRQREKAANRAEQDAINNLAHGSTASQNFSGSRIRANGKIAEASSKGLQIVSFKNGLNRWKWEYVFRLKDPKKAELLAQCMEAGVANNKYIKYCGNYGELYDKTKNLGFDVSKVKSRTCTTCSPFVSVCVNYAGISMNRGWNAANESTALAVIKKRSKHFEIIHNPKIAQDYTKLYRGDILFKNKYNGMGHTVVCT